MLRRRNGGRESFKKVEIGGCAVNGYSHVIERRKKAFSEFSECSECDRVFVPGG